MADLMTRIAADDSDFNRKLDNMDRRITGFGQNMKGAFRGVRDILSGFGLSAAVSGIQEMADQVLAIQKEQTSELNRQIESSTARNQAHMDFRRSLEGELTLTEKVSKLQTANLDAIAKAQKESVDKIRGESTKTSFWSAMMNESWRGMLPRAFEAGLGGANPVMGVSAYASRLMSEDQGRRIGEIVNAAGKDASIEMNQSAKSTRAAALKMISDDAKRSSNIVKERAGDLIESTKQRDERNAKNRQDIADRLAEERIGALRTAGRERDADIEATRLRYSRFGRDVAEADFLGVGEKRNAMAALAERLKQEEDAISSRFLDRPMFGAGTQALGVGGATFRQQLASLDPVKQPIQKIADNSTKTVAALDKLVKGMKPTAPVYTK